MVMCDFQGDREGGIKMLKHRNLLLFSCLVFTVILIGLVSSCNKPAASPVTAESPAAVKPVDSPVTAESPAAVKPAPVESPAEVPGEIPVTVSADDEFDIAQYKLEIYGLVDNPMTLSFESILAYPAENQTAGLYCDSEFLSAYTWTGVPVSTLLNEAGLKPEAEVIIFKANDGYAARLPPADIMAGGIILAYEANGEKLSDGDGYPLRVVANGYNGSVWVRFVTSIEVK